MTRDKEGDTTFSKLCYFKSGNVVNELLNTLSTSKEITGGPNYYIYSTKNTLSDKAKILYLSFGEGSISKSAGNCTAKTIKATKFHKYSGLHVLKLAVQILRFKPNHVICAKRRWLHIIYLVSKIVGASFTISVHTDISAKNKFDNAVIYHLLKLSDSVICHGPYLRSQVNRITHNDSKIIEYNASCKDLIGLSSSLPVNADKIRNKKIIAFVGRVETRKGVHDLYEACKKLLRDNDDLVLCFAGGGQECAALIERSRADGFDKQVIVLNQLNRAQIANLLRQSPVTPTKSNFPEGRCMAAMEALAMGVPVIVPDFGPFPFLVKNGVKALSIN